MDAFSQANLLYIDEEYELSINFYSKAVEEMPMNPFVYSCRAAVCLKLKKYAKALEDSNKAISLDVS